MQINKYTVSVNSNVICSIRVNTGFRQPWMGLGISVTLFILALILTKPSAAASCELEAIGSPGVLQLTWIVGQAPDIAKDLLKAHDGKPNSSSLLKAGKNIEVHMESQIVNNGTKASGSLDGVPELPGSQGRAPAGEERRNTSEV